MSPSYPNQESSPLDSNFFESPGASDERRPSPTMVESAMRSFVIGGAGFIGSHLVEQLVARGPVTIYR